MSVSKRIVQRRTSGWYLVEIEEYTRGTYFFKMYVGGELKVHSVEYTSLSECIEASDRAVIARKALMDSLTAKGW